MRKNGIKKAIKAISKKAQKNQVATVAIAATTTSFAIFGAVEAGIIVKNKAQEKIASIKAKKEAKKAEDAAKVQQTEVTEATEETAKQNEQKPEETANETPANETPNNETPEEIVNEG